MNKYIVWIVSWIWMMLSSPNADAQVKDSQYKIAHAKQQLHTLLLDKKVNELTLEEIKNTMLAAINEIRVQKWLQKVSLYNSDVEQIHSTYLFASKGDESLWMEDHVDAKNRTFYERALEAHIPIDQECRWECRKSGENLAASSMTIKEIIDVWTNSPIHAANLYTASFNYIVIWCAPWWNNIVVWFLHIK